MKDNPDIDVRTSRGSDAVWWIGSISPAFFRSRAYGAVCQRSKVAGSLREPFATTAVFAVISVQSHHCNPAVGTRRGCEFFKFPADKDFQTIGVLLERVLGIFLARVGRTGGGDG